MALIPAETIRRKRDGQDLSSHEIQLFFDGYMKGEIPEYQMAALLMAIYFRGMSREETVFLTQYMRRSGSSFTASGNFPRADKHSTGGVGDKTSLLIGPIVAAAGIEVPMIAGRGLGHTGGTLDKLESIPGFNCRISLRQADEQIARLKIAIMGQTEEICPADRRLYSLRDVTGTVESIPLICASILSKKLAENLNGLILDIKFGSGAFMKTPEQARALARALLEVAADAGLKGAALLTSMEQPLGRYAGNALEVRECLDIFAAKDPASLGRFALETRALSLELAAWMLYLVEKAPSLAEARQTVEGLLSSGAAFAKFEEVCRAQGGDFGTLPTARYRKDLLAEEDGYVQAMNTEQIGYATLELKAGRRIITDPIDPTAGLEFHKKLGDPVRRGDPIFTLFGDDERLFAEAETRLRGAFRIGAMAVPADRLILEHVVVEASS